MAWLSQIVVYNQFTSAKTQKSQNFPGKSPLPFLSTDSEASQPASTRQLSFPCAFLPQTNLCHRTTSSQPIQVAIVLKIVIGQDSPLA
jgi:hypothetical protein